MKVPYVPRGFTREEVECANKELPDPLRHALATGTRRLRIAVHNCDCQYVKPESSFLDGRTEDTAVMRVLDYDLLAEFDSYTGKIVYVWKLVGGNQG